MRGKVGGGGGFSSYDSQKTQISSWFSIVESVASGQHTMGVKFYIYVTVVKDLNENCNAQNVK